MYPMARGISVVEPAQINDSPFRNPPVDSHSVEIHEITCGCLMILQGIRRDLVASGHPTRLPTHHLRLQPRAGQTIGTSSQTLPRF